ncbi:hypothetical protein FM102_13845 [Corynebacterium glutamicum]|nr:hypothetical protein FM102_13845 [Corynebacterium glutamicum]
MYWRLPDQFKETTPSVPLEPWMQLAFVKNPMAKNTREVVIKTRRGVQNR